MADPTDKTLVIGGPDAGMRVRYRDPIYRTHERTEMPSMFAITQGPPLTSPLWAFTYRLCIIKVDGYPMHFYIPESVPGGQDALYVFRALVKRYGDTDG